MGTRPVSVTKPASPLPDGLPHADDTGSLTAYLALGAACLTGIQVGAVMVATRYIINDIDPVTLAMLRYAVGALCLAPATFAVRKARFATRDILPVALLGIGQFGILIALLNYGLKTVPSGKASLLFATFPLLTMLVGAVMRVERMTLPKTIGVVASLAGVALVLGNKLLSELGQGTTFLGELAILGAALVGAICTVFYRPYLRRYPTVKVSAFAMLASVIFLGLFSGMEGYLPVITDLNGVTWAVIIGIGISSGGAFFLWLWALSKASPTRVTVFLSLSPITATIAGNLLLAEPVTLAMIAGLACVTFGLFISTRGRRP